MAVYRIEKPKDASRKKVTGPKSVVLTRDPAQSKPYMIRIYKGTTLITTEPFINKSAAEQWAALNAPGVEIKDLTGDGKARSTVCSE